MSKLRPLGDKLVVKPVEKQEMTKSGIYIPETAKEKPQEGEVIAVGTGKWVQSELKPLEVKVGDRILFAKYGGDEVKVDGQEYKIITESDILAIIEN